MEDNSNFFGLLIKDDLYKYVTWDSKMEWYQNKMYLESMKLKYGNAIQNHEYRRFKLH